MTEGPPAKPPHEAIKDLFVETPTANQALGDIETLRLHGRQNGWSECLLLAGPSRVGKTALVRHYKTRFPDRMEERQVIRPVLVVRLDAETRLHSLISATLRAMSDPRPDHGKPGARTERALRLIENQRTEVLILDEFQHLIDSDTDKIAYKAGDSVKSILEAGTCRVVMSGVTHAQRVLHTNGQLIGRSRPPIYLHPTDWRDNRQRLDFRVFLNEIERSIGLPSPSQLGGLARAHRIHHFARGLNGYAHKLIREALLLRHVEGEQTPCVTDDQLARSADRLLLNEPARRINPFRTAPPEDYDPAPMFESLKEPPRAKRVKGDDDARLFD